MSSCMFLLSLRDYLKKRGAQARKDSSSNDVHSLLSIMESLISQLSGAVIASITLLMRAQVSIEDMSYLGS